LSSRWSSWPCSRRYSSNSLTLRYHEPLYPYDGMLFIAGTRVRYIASLLVLALPVVYKARPGALSVAEDHSFLDPWKDSQGSGFQLVQSFISLRQRRVFRTRARESNRSSHLLKHMGFHLCLSGGTRPDRRIGRHSPVSRALSARGSIANRTQNRFHFYLAYGLTMMIAVQAAGQFFGGHRYGPDQGASVPS